MSAAKEMWQEYHDTGSKEARDRLILAHLPLVKQLAGRLAVRLAPFVSQEDLEGYGVFGLIEAIERYNPAMGADFQTYAYQRIRGTMLDEVRRQAWVPRSLWHRLKMVNAAREGLAAAGGGQPSDAEVAEAAGLKPEEFRRLARHFGAIGRVSLDDVRCGRGGEAVRWQDVLEDPNSPDPLEQVVAREDSALLAEAVKRLEERDRLVLALYYQESLTLKEIGRVLGVTESRVCQLHSKAVGKLRALLKQMVDGGTGD
ncbi:MAG: sigma-70 family RNA polymerase sigma factor [Desulfotomaculales bacterium]